MADPETITLERSGLSLPWDAAREQFRGSVHGWRVALRDPANDRFSGGHWRAWAGETYTAHGTRADCIKWLDDRAMELRAALLPPGAIVVADTEETVERIARALAGKVRPLDRMSTWAQIRYREDAATVLAALREEGR